MDILEQEEHSAWQRASSQAKVVLSVQTLILFFLSYWMYEEVQNNIYLQTYLNNLPFGRNLPAIAIGLIASIDTVTIALYFWLRRAKRGVIREVSNQNPAVNSVVSGFMDGHTEQHLVDMIRKKNQVEGQGTAPTIIGHSLRRESLTRRRAKTRFTMGRGRSPTFSSALS